MTTESTRTAVVFGGASGIGRAIAGRLAAGGDRVLVVDRSADAATAVAGAIGGAAAVADITDEDAVALAFAEVGPVDVVVNSAGVSTVGTVQDLAVSEFRAVVDVCLTGAFIVLQHAARSVVDGGAVVSLSSLNARQPGIGMSAYCAAKAGLSMLTEVAALELAPRRVRVNAVAPGYVPTPLTELAASVPGLLEDYVENTPLGCVGTTEDIADAAVFLCSPAASWITGEVMDVNGGAHLQRYPDVMGHVNGMLA